ncbi:uncharacterized protein CDV56_105996 [Aspergillus thermomutatus]|uniref:Uncharacterized protein n=1 Tax=Aspergillus thermomutatus TaxID=41047 RepID=A0A397GWE1_ASPTH|nr:uncharacterized protein CDV56_105996 [Aspergillus thermomutatus]RHZ52380.1 hypothetical protein CDV56_105996 [Aspergillus thermomutatus]
MAVLKRFFQAEKSSSADAADSDEARGPPTQPVNQLQRSRSLNTSRQLDADEHFQSIEKQFEELHDQMQARPLSSRSRAPSSRASSRFTQRNPRHVDLLDALFSSHRYQMQIANALSPTTPFNEDIAERNMVRFLQGQPRTQKVYSRLISALYQEDVADRNIAKNRMNKRPISRSASSRSQAASTCASQSSGEVPQREVSSRLLPRANGGKITSLSSRPGSSSSSQLRSLRAHRSAPNIMAEFTNASEEQSAPNAESYLGVPPAHKQGDKWSNTPLPDSPTLPLPMTQGWKMGPSKGKGSLEVTRSSPSTHGKSPRLNSKKNVRDLSINTELAARGKPTSRISHHAIQPPTPSNYDMKQNLSIAEVMNSPLPVGTPTSISPLPPSNQKVAEIMDMFKQAFNSSAGAISPHPTFETLQDAIVREINSHEAFRRVPVPEAGPLFTLSSSQDPFDSDEISATQGLTRSFSAKESQFFKLIRRGSFKKHRRGSERKSISSSVPVMVFRQGSESSSRRRHTDAPPPSPGFLNVKQDGTLAGNDQPEEQVTYMDILLRAQKSPPNSRSRRSPKAVRDSGRTQSAGTLGSHSVSDISHTTPSVYYMRAQTSSSSSDGRTSFSADDSDEEIIQLPSIGTPRFQIQAVDQNNVAYMMESTSPRNAYRLMNWPHGTRRNLSIRGGSVMSANKPADHSPRHEHQVRCARSVESY